MNWDCPARVVVEPLSVRGGPLTAGFASPTFLAQCSGRRTNAHVYVQVPTGWDGFKVQLYSDSAGIRTLLVEFVIGAAGMYTQGAMRSGLVLSAMDVPSDDFLVAICNTGTADVNPVQNTRIALECWGPE